MATASSSKASSSKRKAIPTTAGKTKKSKPAPTSNDDASIPLGRALASTEKRIRDSAVRSLRTYLSTNGAHTIPTLELQKLWKGLFYCFWMSDKPLIQQRLADDLASLVLVHPSSSTNRSEAGLAFLEGFWDTITAEWGGLDKHRVDKFYLLVRRFVASGFQLLAEEKWPPVAVKTFQGILGKFDGVLSTNNPKTPDSLTYHLSDMYLDELEKVVEKVHDQENEQAEETEEGEEEELVLVPTLELLMPFVDALATAKSKAMYERIWANVFQPLLEDTLRASARDDEASLSDDEEEASLDDDKDEDVEEDEGEDLEEGEDEEEGGDETTNGTEFHSFADESGLPANDDESERSLPSDSEEDDEEDDAEDDVRFPLLLALSSVPTPTTANDDEEPDASSIDVALVLRKSIFQALFTAASRKDATEARRRLLYQLWRDEQDRLNDQAESSSSSSSSSSDDDE